VVTEVAGDPQAEGAVQEVVITLAVAGRQEAVLVGDTEEEEEDQ